MRMAIINQKGGVGKTSVTVNLGYGLARSGKKTLIVDTDPQAHSTAIFAPDLPRENTINDLFSKRTFETGKAIRPAYLLQDIDGEEKQVPAENLSIMPSNIHLAATSEIVISRTHREKILNRHLNAVKKRFDFILIDCPPTLGVLTINAIYAAELIFIPTSYSKYSLDGISDLFTSIREVKETDSFNYRILRNMKDTRASRTNEAIEAQLAPFESNLAKTVVRRSESINQAQMLCLPVQVFDSKSTGALDFDALTGEVLNYG